MTNPTENKLRQMEEEMNRFEAEISSQTQSVSGGFAFPPATAFVPSQLLHSSNTTPLPVAPSVPLYIPPPIVPTFQPPAPPPAPAQAPPAYLPDVSSTATTAPKVNSTSQPKTTTIDGTAESDRTQTKVISAGPQMAGPNELAARAREAAAVVAQSKVDEDLDDDVTRALLAAAAGVTYNTHGTSFNGGSKTQPSTPATTTTTKPSFAKPLTANADTQTAKPVPPTAPPNPPQALPPPPAPPGYRAVAAAMASSAETEPWKKKKRYIRSAAGVTWEDPTLAEWDPNDFRMFCGDLGNEINDDTLARAFNRYSSFQRAHVVRDKRTNKSRGYGFVSFSDPDDFTRAMREMNGKYVGNRPIKLKRSEWKNRQLSTIRKKEKEKKKLGLKN